VCNKNENDWFISSNPNWDRFYVDETDGTLRSEMVTNHKLCGVLNEGVNLSPNRTDGR